MKKKLFTPSTLLLLGMLSLFSACNNDDDGTNKAQEIAGKYEGYSIGSCAMFTDYVMGEKSVATIVPNEDGTINVTYDSGSGEFKLNNIKVTSKTFEGSGQVELSMNDKPAGAKDFTLTGSIDEQQKLTLKVNVPSVMGGLIIEFIQGTLPISYHVSGTYNKEANLSVSVGSTTYPDITDCKVSIKRSSDDTVELTLKGLSNLNSSQTGRAMNLGDFTVTDVKVTSTDNSIFKIEGSINTTDTNNTPITGTLSGTVSNSETNITFTFNPVPCQLILPQCLKERNKKA